MLPLHIAHQARDQAMIVNAIGIALTGDLIRGCMDC